MVELLAEPIRRYIHNKGWESLRSIQAAAIQHILADDRNYILESRTASGKTEAAFLPILSRVSFKTPGVKVLYISPLIALINDQFTRIEELCEYLDVPVTKWHGEAKRSLKEKLIRDPEGVLLITPESLEAMFCNAPQHIPHLFGTLDYVVIDEIHSFLGTDRGVQLQSLLSRLPLTAKCQYKVVGLSATIGDHAAVKQMTGNAANTAVLRDPTGKEIDAEFKYFPDEGAELPLDLLKDLYSNTKDNKVLIFPNSRGRAEEIAVKLNKISDRVGGHHNYFSHHSSVDREVREYVEEFAKSNQRYPFAISCTSTLELGIDIGSVDKVVQVDATNSIASLIQRVGRSGRKDGTTSMLLFYATEPWSLIQSLACFSLYREKFVEPIGNNQYAYDILLHQILSTVKQLSGCSFEALQERMSVNYAFAEIKPAAVTAIVKHLLQLDLLELIGGELIIGVEGERMVNARDFYAVFKTDPNYKVVHADRPIGEIPLTSIIVVDENIFLAARIWKVVDIDEKSKKITVIPAKDGKKPKFSGGGMDVNVRVRERMLELLMTGSAWSELDKSAADVLAEYRKMFGKYAIEDLKYDRPVTEKGGSCIVYTFQGSGVNRAIAFVLQQMKPGFVTTLVEEDSTFHFSCDFKTVESTLTAALANLAQVDAYLTEAIAANPGGMVNAKWGVYLPPVLQKELLKATRYDFDGAGAFLANVRLVRHTDH
ncbi:DEAD/DEAH box helicase [Mucilaginibacter sp. HC2]|uniref:DEAD/DEAH box helicase n=1 Tax=Mucilaginibacter inviolabilis TaxID=2714892 RepID=UPI00140BE8D9|nr:DEAD/DEAH box helicase [Mucilaginibacter inviolabilis]NHA03454.1 DEAD/DEAH box helicase [Mucilaginibacter inviolabilis]